jgi:hypothetical protein
VEAVRGVKAMPLRLAAEAAAALFIFQVARYLESTQLWWVLVAQRSQAMETLEVTVHFLYQATLLVIL